VHLTAELDSLFDEYALDASLGEVLWLDWFSRRVGGLENAGYSWTGCGTTWRNRPRPADLKHQRPPLGQRKDHFASGKAAPVGAVLPLLDCRQSYPERPRGLAA